MQRRMLIFRWGAALIAVTATVLTTVVVGAAADPADDTTELREAAGRGFAANIRYTEYGIPHIKAADFAGLGYGFAAARDTSASWPTPT